MKILQIISLISGHYLIFNIVRLDLPSMRNCSGTDYLQIQVWCWLLSVTGVVLIIFRYRCLQIQVSCLLPSVTGFILIAFGYRCGKYLQIQVRYGTDNLQIQGVRYLISSVMAWYWFLSDTGVLPATYRWGTYYFQIQVRYLLIAIADTGVVLVTFRCRSGLYWLTFDTDVVLITSLDI